MKITSPKFDFREIEELKETLESGWVTQGPKTVLFEQAVAKYHQLDHALATTSCTAALHLATLALGLGAGDEVIVPAFTWITSANAAEYVGAKVIFVDVCETTYNLDLESLESLITERTKAIIAVHLFGLAADMDVIMKIAEKNNLAVIEDAACAIGTNYKGKPIGAFGDFGCFSFHPRKVVTTGEGGMVTTNNEALAKIARSLRNHGSTGMTEQALKDPRPYRMATFNRLGYNLRLSDIQAAVGVAQMEKLERLLQERRKIAETYLEMLKDIEELVLPLNDAGHSYQSFVIRLVKGGNKKRNQIMDDLAFKQIETRPGTHAVHRLGYYKEKYGLQENQFPVAASCEDTTITLPIFPGMKTEDQQQVVDQIKRSLVR